MGKMKQLAAVITDLFPKSDKAVSEKLSTEEFNEFSAEVTELNKRLEAQVEGNKKVVADLNAKIAELSEVKGKLEAAEQLVAGSKAKLATVIGERDKYKAHYEKAAEAGMTEGEADSNSQGATKKLSGYNAQAVELFNKVHGGK